MFLFDDFFCRSGKTTIRKRPQTRCEKNVRCRDDEPIGFPFIHAWLYKVPQDGRPDVGGGGFKKALDRGEK